MAEHRCLRSEELLMNGGLLSNETLMHLAERGQVFVERRRCSNRGGRAGWRHFGHTGNCHRWLGLCGRDRLGERLGNGLDDRFKGDDRLARRLVDDRRKPGCSGHGLNAVSYTHLTLPTILLV